MKVTVIALGYVGLVNAVVLAENGYDVTAYDKDSAKVKSLQKGLIPMQEDGLTEALYKARKRIEFVDEEKAAYESSHVFFVAVDTPPLPDGGSDLTNLKSVISSIEQHATEETYVIIRSTVPVGTNGKLSASAVSSSGVKIHFISNPEFLSEGHSLIEERQPYRIVVGTSEKSSRDLMQKIYAKAITAGVPYYEMEAASAEFTKYASNLFLSLKISYINELSRLAEPLGADIKAVALAMGADPRIGHSMLHAGVGYGGACLPKDGSALAESARENGLRLSLVEDTTKINETQPAYFYKKMVNKLGSLDGKRIAVLGLAFKAGTSDVRKTVATYFVESLLKDGAIVTSYDPSPIAEEGFTRLVPLSVKHLMAHSLGEAVKGADALLILTEDRAFAELPEDDLCKLMKGRVIFDGRNLYDPWHFRYFDYVSVGRAEHKASH